MSYDRKKQVQSKYRKEMGVCVYFYVTYRKRSRECKGNTGETEDDVKVRI